jgi:serine protease Do
VVEQLKKNGSVSRGWLGVKIQNVDEDTAAALGLADAKGALVSEVTPDGPAAESGLKAQDAIVAINSDKISDSKDLARKIADIPPGTSVDVKVWRNNAEQSVKVKLGKFPGSSEEIAKLERGGQAAPDEEEETTSMDLSPLGLKLSPLRGPDAKDGGVMITEVDPSSDAAEKGLKAGDTILEVDRQPVSKPEDVADSVKKVKEKGRTAVMLHIKSADQKRIVSLRFGKEG